MTCTSSTCLKKMWSLQHLLFIKNFLRQIQTTDQCYPVLRYLSWQRSFRIAHISHANKRASATKNAILHVGARTSHIVVRARRQKIDKRDTNFIAVRTFTGDDDYMTHIAGRCRDWKRWENNFHYFAMYNYRRVDADLLESVPQPPHSPINQTRFNYYSH